MQKNRLRWFKRDERRNNDEIGERRIQRNQKWDRLKKKWMEVIRENMRACSVNKEMVKNKKNLG